MIVLGNTSILHRLAASYRRRRSNVNYFIVHLAIAGKLRSSLSADLLSSSLTGPDLSVDSPRPLRGPLLGDGRFRPADPAKLLSRLPRLRRQQVHIGKFQSILKLELHISFH